MKGCGFRKLWQAIAKYKLLFGILVVVQMVLLFSFAVVLVEYQVEIVEHAQNVVGPLSGANYDADAIQSGSPFIEDFLPVIQGYRQLKETLTNLFWMLALFFFVGNGMFWVTHTLQQHGWKKYKQVLLRYGVVSVCTLIFFVLVGYLVLQSLFTVGQEPVSPEQLLPYVYVFTTVIYLTFLLFVSQLHVPVRLMPSAVWSLIRRPFVVLRTLGCNLVALAFSFYGMYLSTQNYEPFLVLSFLVFCVVLVLTRMYWVIMLGVKQMKHIILDTNAVMAVGELGIDIFTEIDNAMSSLYDVNVLSGTVKELEKIVAEQRGKFRDAAQLALMLLKQKNVTVIPSTGYVDDLLVDYSKNGYLILTQDVELKKRLSPPFLTIRQKKTVMVVQ